MRVLVTGSGGFVGGHLIASLKAAGDDVVAWDGGPDSPDVTNRDALLAALDGLELDGVYHLAAQSRVDLSWSEPAQTLAVNAGGTANLVGGLAATDSRARVVLMSSAEVYGLVDEVLLPVSEDAPLAPRSPYGVSKLAAEQIGVLSADAAGLELIVCRPFNQIGPGQAPTFVTAAFAKQVVDNERNGGGEIRVGNLSATRDFLDVRDAVGAYRSLMVDGAPGEIYNVAAGRELAVQGLLDGLIAQSTVAQQVVVDEDRFRPNDLARMFGSSDKLRGVAGWEPTRSIDETLADVLDEWRRHMPAEEG